MDCNFFSPQGRKDAKWAVLLALNNNSTGAPTGRSFLNGIQLPDRFPAALHLKRIHQQEKNSAEHSEKHRVTLRSKKMQRTGMTDDEATSNFRNH